MSSNQKPAIYPLEKGTELTLKESEDRFKEIESAFEWIQGKYSGFFGSFKRNIKDEHGELLSSCFGALFALVTMKSVKDEYLNGEVATEDILSDKISIMQQNFLIFAAKFKNTGLLLVK